MAPIKGEGTVYQRKSDGMWVCALDLGTDESGKRRRKTVTAKNKADLITKRRKLIRDLEDGLVVAHTGMTVETWLDKWHNDISKRRLKPRVWAGYGSQIERHIKPAIGKQRLDKLTPAHIRSMHDRIANTPSKRGDGNVSSRVVEVCHNILSRALRDAVNEGLIRDNPCDRVDRPAVNSREREPITVENAKKLLLSAGEANDTLTAMWAAALLLGARQSELMGLTWSRVNLQTGTVDLSWQLQQLPFRHGCVPVGKTPNCGRKTGGGCPKRTHDVPRDYEHHPVDGGLCFTRPKTKASIRAIPIPPLLVQALATHKKNTPAGDHDLVWVRKDGKPWRHKQVLEAWQTATTRAGIPACDMHSTRHTTASLLMELGVPETVIMQILGHSTVLSTKSYLHANLEMAQKAMAQLGQALTSDTETVQGGAH